MNKDLMETLSTYYWGEEYRGNSERFTEADEMLEKFKEDLSDSEIEEAVHKLCNRYEYEGFLQGYAYCLLLLGRGN